MSIRKKKINKLNKKEVLVLIKKSEKGCPGSSYMNHLQDRLRMLS